MNESDFSNYPLDIQANTVAVDSSGKFALLGCRRELVFVNLDDLAQKEASSCYKRHSLQAKYDPSAIQWHPTDNTFFITALDVRGVIWELNDRQLRRYATLRGFTRGISALDWNPNDTNMIATTSLGNLQAVSIWDFRDTKKHVICSESIAGASQVRWNRIRPQIFATAHESTLRLWDMRNSRIEWNSIPAHVAKISDLDWSPYDEHELVTVGQECKLKVWYVSGKERCLCETASTGITFSQARYAPFGRAIVTKPSALKRADPGVVLWSLSGNSSVTESITVVRCFGTHPPGSYAVAFDWRRGEASPYRPPQIVSWSSEHNLNLWNITEELQEQCGVMPDAATSPNLRTLMSSTPDSPAVVSFVVGSLDSAETAATVTPPLVPNSVNPEVSRDLGFSHLMSSPEHSRLPTANGELVEGPHHSTPGHQFLRRTPSSGGVTSLFHELQQLMHSLDSHEQTIRTEELDASVRRCRFTVNVLRLKLRLQISFPSGYPNGVPPNFTLLQPRPNWEQTRWDHLQKTLQDSALSLVSQSRGCVEFCLRQLVNQLEVMQMNQNPKQMTMKSKSYHDGRRRSRSHRHSSSNKTPPWMMPDESTMFDDVLGQTFLPSYVLQDSRGYAPMPRMVVARFSRCGNYLVCFRRAPISGESSSTPWAVLDLQGPPVHYTVAASPPASGHLDSNSDGGRSTTPRRLRYHRSNVRRCVSQAATGQQSSRHKIGMMPINTGIQAGPVLASQPTNSNSASMDRRNLILPSTVTSSVVEGPQVLLYDVTRLHIVNRRMAEEYRLPSEVSDESSLAEVCEHNANVAANHGRTDLVQLWKTCCTLCSSSLRPTTTPSTLPPWPSLAFGRKLIESWIKHYSALRDVQTLAMLSHLLKNLDSLWKFDHSTVNTSNGGGGAMSTQSRDRNAFGNSNCRRRTFVDEESLQYHTITTYDSNYRIKKLLGPPKIEEPSILPTTGLKDYCSRPRSCSWSEQCDDTTIFDKEDEKPNPVLDTHRENCRMFSTALSNQMDAFLRFYGDLLYVWDILNTRTRLLKVVDDDPSVMSWNLMTACHVCSNNVAIGGKCPYCYDSVTQVGACVDTRTRVLCALCREPVVGLTAVCEVCGHHGHWEHMMKWFQSTKMCPQGCGCRCRMFSSEQE